MKIAVAIPGLFLLALSVPAQTTATSHTLDQILEEALSRNLRLLARCDSRSARQIFTRRCGAPVREDRERWRIFRRAPGTADCD